MLTSGSKDGTIINHDLRIKNHIINVINTKAGSILDLEWDMTGKYLASGSLGSIGKDAEMNIWDIRTFINNSHNPEENYEYSPMYYSSSKSWYGFNNKNRELIFTL